MQLLQASAPAKSPRRSRRTLACSMHILHLQQTSDVSAVHTKQWHCCSRLWMSQHVSAAVISGGLDCKLIHWDVSSKCILGSRQAGMQQCMKVSPTEVSCACGSAAVHPQHKLSQEAFQLLALTALPTGRTFLRLVLFGNLSSRAVSSKYVV